MANGFPPYGGQRNLWAYLHSLFDNPGMLAGFLGPGKIWYVDATGGNSSATDGNTWDSAFATMAQAFTKIHSGDTILFTGKVLEQVTAPVQIFDVKIIGIGNRPRHADSAPAGGNLATAQWGTPASPVAATPLIKVLQQGWLFYNILFSGPTDAACIQLYRDAGSGNDERDASHCSVIACRFASGFYAIHDPGGCFNVLVKDNVFQALTDACIIGVGNIGQGQTQWQIVNNQFTGFTNGVKIAAFQCLIQNNSFTDGGTPNTTFVLNVSNGGGGDNIIVLNFFQTATANFNTPDVVGNATDVWTNYSINAAAAGVSGVYEVGQPA